MVARMLGFTTVAVFIIGTAFPAAALVEISGNYGRDSSYYGSDGQNRRKDETYTAAVALYFLSLTALELHYSRSQKVAEETFSSTQQAGRYSLRESENEVLTSIYGASIKQVFAMGPRRFLRPSISLGYAKFIVSDKMDYTLRDSVAGQDTTVVGTVQERREDSFYVNFALSIKLTGRLSLQGSVQSVMPDFDFDHFEDNMKYLVGFGLSLF